MTHNILFNTCRESGDHGKTVLALHFWMHEFRFERARCCFAGPFNSWDRQVRAAVSFAP